ncbi:MAG: hypothetical protein ACYDDF_07930 [Thermoplasmatota archaeon]
MMVRAAPLRLPRGLIPVVGGLLALFATLAILRETAFPSGADPGHMLAFARGVEGSLRYAPLVPFLFAILYAAAGNDPHRLVDLVDLMSVLSAAVFAASIARLAWATFEERGVAAWAFFIAAASPTTLYEVLWGGLAQFWGLAFAVFALADIIRWRSGAWARIRAVGFGILTIYSHAYAAVFLASAGFILLLWTRLWDERALLRSSAAAFGAGAVLVLPIMGTYDRILAQETGGTGGPAILSPSAMLASLAQVFDGEVGALAAFALILAAVTAWCVWHSNRDVPPRRSASFAMAMAVGSGFLALLAITPADLAVRPFYVIPIAVIPLLAHGIAQWGRRDGSGGGPRGELPPERSTPSPARAWGAPGGGEAPGPRPWTRWAPRPTLAGVFAALLVATALVFAGTSVSMVQADHAYFSPLPSEALAHFVNLSHANIHVFAVYSPIPNIDAWWLEGITGKRAIATDLARFYTFNDEIHAMQEAKLGAAGESTASAGAILVATSPDRQAPASWSLLTNALGDIYPLLLANETASRLVSQNGSVESLHPLGAAVHEGFQNGTLVDTWARTSPAAGTISRSITVENGTIVVTYRLPLGTSHIELETTPGANSTFEGRPGLVHAVSEVWAIADVRDTLAMEPEGHLLTPSVLRIDIPAADGVAVLQLSLPDYHVTTLAAPIPAAQHFQSIGVDAVYLRGTDPGLRERFVSDPAFSVIESFGDTTVLRLNATSP